MRAKNFNKANGAKVILVGRYLVRATKVFDENQDIDKRNHLIEINSKKQEALTQYLDSLPFVKKINTKTFSIEARVISSLGTLPISNMYLRQILRLT